MSDSSPQDVACPGCGKTYRWQEKFAGRKVRCKACNGVFAMPTEPPSQADKDKRPKKATSHVDDSEDLAIETCPSCNNPVKVGAVICVSCGFNIKEGKQIETAVESDEVASKGGLLKKILGRGKAKDKGKDKNKDGDKAKRPGDSA